MTLLRAAAMSAAANDPSCSSRATSTPTFLSTRFLALRPCSNTSGSSTSLTPCARPSAIEFQPACVRNPPTDAWASNLTCGTQPRHRTPRPATASRSSKPSGRPPEVESVGALNAQRKGSPAASKPSAIRCSCALVSFTSLPKAAYTTELGACPSSQRSVASWPATSCCGAGGNRPTGITGFS
ncbi:hypothetical protein VPH35_061709 [Triticum aestivum]|uniref:Uncharacterized protein n=1 Tax=Aegilops tauschii subsp. strangulata TaxID=200361 RepID=A0A453FZV1_AEGTS